jgi:hypothetical protein
MTLTKTSSTATYANATLSGSFNLTGTPAGGSATTVAGSVSGTCYAALQ